MEDKNNQRLRANLSKACLCEVDLRGANLNEAILCKADLSWADLRKVNLSGANLSEAKLTEVDLSEANLSGAHIKEANLSEVKNISEAKELDTADFTDAIMDDEIREYLSKINPTVKPLDKPGEENKESDKSA